MLRLGVKGRVVAALLLAASAVCYDARLSSLNAQEAAESSAQKRATVSRQQQNQQRKKALAEAEALRRQISAIRAQVEADRKRLNKLLSELEASRRKLDRMRATSTSEEKMAAELKAARESLSKTDADVDAARRQLARTLAQLEIIGRKLRAMIAAGKTAPPDVKAVYRQLSRMFAETESAHRQLGQTIEKVEAVSKDLSKTTVAVAPEPTIIQKGAKKSFRYRPYPGGGSTSGEGAPPAAPQASVPPPAREPPPPSAAPRPAPAPSVAADGQPKIAPKGDEVRTPAAPDRVYWAVRDLIAPDYNPSEQYGAVGIVAFTSKPSPDDKRAVAICENFKGTLVLSAEAERQGHPKEEQIATLWPVLNAAQIRTAAPTWPCEQLLSLYDLGEALQALNDAMRAKAIGSDRDLKNHRGPILIAWSPSKARGTTGSVALYYDLSNANTDTEIEEAFRVWRSEVEERPELWSNGWDLDKLRRYIRRVADKYGKEMLSLI